MKWTRDQMVQARLHISEYANAIFPPVVTGSGHYRPSPEQIEAVIQTYLLNDTPFDVFAEESRGRERRRQEWVEEVLRDREKDSARRKERLAALREREPIRSFFRDLFGRRVEE